MSIETLLKEFAEVSAHPHRQIKKYKVRLIGFKGLKGLLSVLHAFSIISFLIEI